MLHRELQNWLKQTGHQSGYLRLNISDCGCLVLLTDAERLSLIMSFTE